MGVTHQPIFSDNPLPTVQKTPPKLLGYGADQPEFYLEKPESFRPQTQVVQNHQVPEALNLTPEYRRQAKVRKTLTTIFLVIGTVLLLLLFAGTSFLGGSMTFFLALIPLTGIVLATVWIGKWDPEPLWVRILAFVWGAAGSVIVTLLIGMLVEQLPGMNMLVAQLTLQAPFVEEFCKGIFVLFLALFARKYFSGPVDGIVYIILAAAGFAFTENILYFLQSQFQGGSVALGTTFFLRAIMSPFAHPMFSLPMGIMLGLAVSKNASKIKTIAYFFIGYIPAVLLHALWNGSSYFVTDFTLWLGYYVFIQIPIFVGAVLVIRYFRKEEANRTYRTLTSYAWSGYFSKEEVEALGTWEGRKYALKWGKNKSQDVKYLVETLNRDVVALTNINTLIDNGDAGKTEQEQLLLTKIWNDKQQLLNV